MIVPLLRMLVVAVVLAAASSHLRALELSEPTWDLEVMRGLTAVNVVTRLSGDTDKARIQRDALQESIQVRLRREGIGLLGERPVLPQEHDAQAEFAILRVTVDDVKRDPNPNGYHEYWLQLELMQDAQLVHHPAVRLPVQTWSRESTGTQREAVMAATVRDALSQALEDFIRDYRSVNGGAENRVPPIAAETGESADSTEGEPEGD